MHKFHSDNMILEVKRCAKMKTDDTKVFQNALLNMEQLGLPEKVMMDLQEKASSSIGTIALFCATATALHLGLLGG